MRSGSSVLSTEVRWRTVCGRAYYAAYKATSNAICELYGFKLDSAMPHETMCHTLASVKGDPEVRDLGNALNTLRLRRVHADYHLDRPFTKVLEKEALEDSGSALEALKLVKSRLPKVTPTW